MWNKHDIFHTILPSHPGIRWLTAGRDRGIVGRQIQGWRPAVVSFQRKTNEVEGKQTNLLLIKFLEDTFWEDWDLSNFNSTSETQSVPIIRHLWQDSDGLAQGHLSFFDLSLSPPLSSSLPYFLSFPLEVVFFDGSFGRHRHPNCASWRLPWKIQIALT